MTSRDFCFWLQGFFEVHDAGSEGMSNVCKGLTSEQGKCIRKHLALVFAHEIDPSQGPPEHQKVLNDLHSEKDLGNVKMRC